MAFAPSAVGQWIGIAIVPFLLAEEARSQNTMDGAHVDLRCGAYCLSAALGGLDIVETTSFEDTEKRLGQPTQLGYSMEQLAAAAKSYGAYTLGVRTTLDELEQRGGRFACIALLEQNGHYVCVYDVTPKDVSIIDPPNRWVVSKDGFTALWGGKALLVSATPIEANPRRWNSAWLLVLASCAVGVVLLIGMRIVRRGRGG